MQQLYGEFKERVQVLQEEAGQYKEYLNVQKEAQTLELQIKNLENKEYMQQAAELE